MKIEVGKTYVRCLNGRAFVATVIDMCCVSGVVTTDKERMSEEYFRKHYKPHSEWGYVSRYGSLNEPSDRSRQLKPPFGIIPQSLFLKNRKKELIRACNRCSSSDFKIPVEWLDEIKDIDRYLKSKGWVN